MYPTLYHLVADLFGVELAFLKIFNSFGTLVAISFLLANYFFAKELKRKEAEGQIHPQKKQVMRGEKAGQSELALSAVFGFIIFYKLVYIVLNFSEFTNDTQGFILSLKGNFIGGLAGAALSAYFTRREKNKTALPKPELVHETVHPHEHVGNMTIIAAVAGLIGAKIFHNLENLDEFYRDPVDALLSFSGLTMYGGLIVGSAAVIYYVYKNKFYVPHFMDACAPALMLAYGVGRIGCQLAGDGDWGIDNTAPQPGWLGFLPHWTWAYTYPHNVNGVGEPIPGCEGKYCFELPVPVFPTPLYEAVACIALFFVLWAIRKKIQAPGTLFSIYLILNGIERFFIEKIRVNTEYHLFGMGITQAEIIATLLFFLGILGLWYFKKLHIKKMQTVQ